MLNNKFWETCVDVLSFKHSNLYEATNNYNKELLNTVINCCP